MNGAKSLHEAFKSLHDIDKRFTLYLGKVLCLAYHAVKEI